MDKERCEHFIYGLNKYCTEILNAGGTICITIGTSEPISKFRMIKNSFKIFLLSIATLFDNKKYYTNASRFLINKDIPFTIDAHYEKN